MHPLEHALYYTCTLLPLLFRMHPMHFLYGEHMSTRTRVAGR